MQLKLTPFIHADAITLTEARNQLRADHGGKLNLGLMFRWCVRGYRPRGWHGDRLRLPTVVLGGRRWLMQQWLDAFQAERIRMGMMLGAREPVTTARMPSPSRRQKDIDKAHKRLQKAGLMK